MSIQMWLFIAATVSAANISNISIYAAQTPLQEQAPQQQQAKPQEQAQQPVQPQQQPTKEAEKPARTHARKPIESPEECARSTQIRRIVLDVLKEVKEHIASANNKATQTVLDSNRSLGLAHSANGTSVKAFELAKEASTIATHALEGMEKAEAMATNLGQQAQAATEKLEHDYERLSSALVDVLKKDSGLGLEDKKKIELAKIEAKQQGGVYEQNAKIQAQANAEAMVGTEKEKWKNIREIVGDSTPIVKIAIAIVVVALCLYIIKYGLPALLNYLTRPHVISETSKKGWFDLFKLQRDIEIDDLIFNPHLQKELSDLLLRVQTAKKYNESLPNSLFYGAPGTGKSAFVKALAYSSGLDYALTSGSEFAKITDLNSANNELRKLLNWSKKSKKGLIVFIDEAESLFANRKLLTTSKTTQDFINTFLSLISDQSQKNVMFVFATNHPFKLDDAITNRIGINVEFTLPDKLEREKILLMYLVKFAQENEKALVLLHSEITQKLSVYAESLEGFSPRTIKFIAEEMIINARRQESKQLTNDIAQAIIDKAKHNLQQTEQWKEDREMWSAALALTRIVL